MTYTAKIIEKTLDIMDTTATTSTIHTTFLTYNQRDHRNLY
ncbi:hypothetical protein [Methanobacterium petrolearium]|nr:hypothetical protein [Methanobacterium petrolearium]MBP1946786.1 hypothetical protein [Methanobacterium petrolearium]